MQSLLGSPTFVAYALTVVVLSLNLIALWVFSGVVRGKTKTAVNPEDAKRFGSTLGEHDAPEVARFLRAHANAQAAIYPFLFLGLVFVLAGGAPGFARIDFGIFVAARILHSVAYAAGKQPWRTVFFLVGSLALLALLGDTTWIVLQRG